jgi:hypothetical protein
MAETTNGPRVSPVNPQWVQDLALRESPSSGKADVWDELNHIDEAYLEFSMASDIPRGLVFIGGIACLAAALFPSVLLIRDFQHGTFEWDWTIAVLVLAISVGLGSAAFFLRLDLRLPKDRPIRFNRRQAKVYANYYTWNHNPFGRWGGGVKVFDWNNLQAEITRQIGASGEVITQRYALELVSCKPGTFEELDRFRLQHGGQTTKQYEEQWELLRHYMARGLEGLPKQNLRNPNPSFVDCLLFAMPWFAPTENGRRTRERMKGFLGTLMMVLMSLLAPMWLLFGVGNYVVMKLAPEATWPPGVDEQSRR